MTRLSDIPPANRRVEGMCVGFFFVDTTPMNLPGDEWTDARETAKFVRSKSERFVAFKRYVDDYGHALTAIDPGWVYFGGKRIRREDILSGKAERDDHTFKPTDVLKSNVASGGFDIMWFAKSKTSYPFYEYDVFIEI